MGQITIHEFCRLHGACSEGRDWAIKNCQTMDNVWHTARPDWLVWVATRPGVLTDRDFRLFAVFAARRVQRLMTDPCSIAAIDIAERYAYGEATDEELSAAWDAASDAAQAAAEAAAEAAAKDAAWDAAWAAAWAAARDAAWAADRTAAEAAAWAAAEAAAQAAARDAQAAWLLANTTPNFQAKEEGR